MDNFLLPEPVDEVDVVVEVSLLKTQDLSNMDDHSLVDEISPLLEISTFMKETEKALSEYFRTGQLTDRNRKILEGCYILAHTAFMLSETHRGAITIGFEIN